MSEPMFLYRIFQRYADQEEAVWRPVMMGQSYHPVEYADEAEAVRRFDALVRDVAAIRAKLDEPPKDGKVWVSLGTPRIEFRLVKIPLAVVKES